MLEWSATLYDLNRIRESIECCQEEDKSQQSQKLQQDEGRN